MSATTGMLERFAGRAAAHPDRVALRPLDDPAAAPLTWGEWHAASRGVAAALVSRGVRAGETVAILAGNRPLWPVADLGILMAGAVSVGLYPTSAASQVQQILADCEATVVIVDTPEQLAKVQAVRAALPALRLVVSAVPDASPDAAPVADWDAWRDAGARALAADAGLAATVARRARERRAEDDALLIYTSGSTGEPKGARIPHRYLAASAASITETLGLGEQDTSLSFLPFCHAAERIFGLYTRIHAGMEAGLVLDHAAVWEAARRYEPTLFGGLPRFWEKLHEGLLVAEAQATGEERARWTRMWTLGRERAALRREGRPVPDETERAWQAAAAPARAVIREWVGGRLRLATSGGAKFPVEIAERLDAAGVTVLGGYGMTEHLCTAFNRPDHYDFASVGPPMPGTVLRIAEDGEVLIERGALTFAGYRGKEEATREAFTADGRWLRTGDLGALDARGALHVTGRKKELIALSTGKKVAPLPIEARLASDPWIAQAMLYGEGRKFVSALLCPRRTTVEAWARTEGVALPYAALLEHPLVQAQLRAAVEKVNAELSRPEQVRRFVLLDRELSVEQDELTPTMKVRRGRVAERFRDRLEALYQETTA